ncbi:hypothetical protein WJX81_002490 [Elliptochloris bilobata]|uniref:Methyltransferase type 11 domain-containing protein n=1 Tax=Elliptochloris bilobata TaxID=381761 RepID=A0AAW1R312_9CHLO
MSAAAAQQPVEKILEEPNWPDSWPFSPADFQRYDESTDERFYDSPRFVTHIDDGAIAALTRHYQEVFPPAGDKGAALLDLCSSWISHYPPGYSAGRIAGLGMNEAELKRNSVLTESVVHDLNADPRLPYEDNAFDVITNTVSVDYLTRPKEVFAEMHRVLKPGGLAIMSFSNRCFPTKAISIWTSTGDADHCWIVGAYFHFSVPGGWTPPTAADITPGPAGGAIGAYFGARSDPMYVVSARKREV